MTGVLVGLGVFVAAMAAFVWWSEVYMARKHMREAIRQVAASERRAPPRRKVP